MGHEQVRDELSHRDVRVCVCVREREREKGAWDTSKFVTSCPIGMYVCVCVREREREKERRTGHEQVRDELSRRDVRV